MSNVNVKLDVRIRPAEKSDKEFVLSLVPRLAEFGPPAWRDAAQMTGVDEQVLNGKFINQTAGTAIFIAEDEAGARLGFIHLQTGADYYNREEHGHVADVIVAPAGEGRGVGRALMQKGEEWAHERGFRWLTLSVFAQNIRARELYGRLGYGEDIMKYVKELS